MQFDITITDSDRNLDFVLSLECTWRFGLRPRMGWQDGGDPGEAPFVEIGRARCVEVIVACGENGVSAVPGLASDFRLESQIGTWCVAQYADEIERAVRKEIQARHDRVRLAV